LKNLHGLSMGLTTSVFFFSILLFASCQKGSQGQQGTPGNTGAAGTTGIQGASGNTILTGDSVPSITLGNIGDYYLELDSSNLYGPKTSLGWGSPVSLTGSTGATGATGDTGVTGAQGPGAMVDIFPVSYNAWTVGGYATAEFAPLQSTQYPAKYYVSGNSQLTQGILDSGMVLVYFTPNFDSNPNQWAPLPYSFLMNIDGYQVNYNWTYITAPGQVTLQFYLTSITGGLYEEERGPTVSSVLLPDAEFKVVVVPGTLTRQIVTAINKKVTKMGQISIN